MRPLFISYRRNPWGTEVLGLSSDCRRRGLRTIVDVSDPDRLTGQAQYDGLRRIIREECDGFILYFTRNVVESTCVWNVEVPAALEAFDRGDFDFIPIFRDVSPSEAATLAPHGRRIVAFGGVVAGSQEEHARTAHLELARSALSSRLHRRFHARPDQPIGLAIRTRESGVRVDDADLMLDWAADYTAMRSGFGPSESVSQALTDVARSVGASGARTVRVSGPAHLSAGLALGYTFHRATGYRLEVEHRGGWWEADGKRGKPRLRVVAHQLDPGASDVLLVVGLSRPEVVRDADRAAEARGLALGGRVVVEPESGAGRQSIKSDTHARGVVLAIADALMTVRADWGTRGAIHAFLATPFAVATLLGHSLNGFGPLYLYEPEHGHQEYVLALTLP